jgi:hypothetical protein
MSGSKREFGARRVLRALVGEITECGCGDASVSCEAVNEARRYLGMGPIVEPVTPAMRDEAVRRVGGPPRGLGLIKRAIRDRMKELRCSEGRSV